MSAFGACDMPVPGDWRMCRRCFFNTSARFVVRAVNGADPENDTYAIPTWYRRHTAACFGRLTY
ncbi:hypothetical protein LOM8899_01144 [Flavimaricola marinus]|uniref:Uncharacterized protein n=1 Tax=Flavimaricola marinus TaxID=1819565 RepID=A0A238LBS8_9RHOB|nr:hypothetical protein LOM8899_01144 [Flavimaricola marinus]